MNQRNVSNIGREPSETDTLRHAAIRMMHTASVMTHATVMGR